MTLVAACFALALVSGGLGLLVGARWLIVCALVLLLLGQITGYLERFRPPARMRDHDA